MQTVWHGLGEQEMPKYMKQQKRYRQKYLKYLYMGAAAINVVLNLLFIPPWGASGAAAASLLTQIATTVLLPAVIRPLRANTKLMLDAVLLRGVLPKKQGLKSKE